MRGRRGAGLRPGRAGDGGELARVGRRRLPRRSDRGAQAGAGAARRAVPGGATRVGRPAVVPAAHPGGSGGRAPPPGRFAGPRLHGLAPPSGPARHGAAGNRGRGGPVRFSPARVPGARPRGTVRGAWGGLRRPRRSGPLGGAARRRGAPNCARAGPLRGARSARPPPRGGLRPFRLGGAAAGPPRGARGSPVPRRSAGPTRAGGPGAGRRRAPDRLVARRHRQAGSRRRGGSVPRGPRGPRRGGPRPRRRKGALMKVLLSGALNPRFEALPEYLASALARLGHEVTLFDHRAFLLPGRLRSRHPALQRFDRSRVNARLLRTVRRLRPDLLIVNQGTVLTRCTIEEARASGVRCVNWFSDSPAEFEQGLAVAPAYD